MTIGLKELSARRKFTLPQVEPDSFSQMNWKPVKVKKIALVWPHGYDPTYSIPLPYGYLKSNLDNAKYQVKIIDNTILDRKASNKSYLEELRQFNPDIVGVSTWSPMFKEALACLQYAKQVNPDIVTCIGGAHATSYYNKFAGTPEIDFIFRGEVELSFPIFLEQLGEERPDFSKVRGLVFTGNNELVVNDMDQENNLDVIKIPDYDAIKLDYYVRHGYRWNCPPNINAPVWITRGCPYRCGFCAAPELNGKPVRTHSVPYMVEWIKYLYYERDTRWINIIDDNFTYHKKYAKEFCRAIINLDLKGLHFGTPNGIRLQRGDKELWRLMKQAGWKTLMVAPETGSERTQKLMKKDIKLETVPGIVQDIKEAGLKVQGFFIVGYPGERPEDLGDSLDLIRKCKFNFVFLNSFQPLPGTPIYDDLVKAGEIPDGLLPHSYSDGTRAYIPPEFSNFNFSQFILKTHLMMMVTNPTNIPYHLSLMWKLFSPRLVVKKVLLILYYSFRPKVQGLDSVIYKPMHRPMHRQAQMEQTPVAHINDV
jgi:radical SAM superfamily enzyme YgiQ (UPF0313 family)